MVRLSTAITFTEPGGATISFARNPRSLSPTPCTTWASLTDTKRRSHSRANSRAIPTSPSTSREAARPVYWEHLGMLDLAGYRADWEARKAWYALHEILPWNEGGGPAGTLVWSDENVSAQGIDSSAVRELARTVF